MTFPSIKHTTARCLPRRGQATETVQPHWRARAHKTAACGCTQGCCQQRFSKPVWRAPPHLPRRRCHNLAVGMRACSLCAHRRRHRRLPPSPAMNGRGDRALVGTFPFVPARPRRHELDQFFGRGLPSDGAGTAPSSPGRGGSGRGARLSSAPLAAVVGGRRVQRRAPASASWGRQSRRKFGGRKGGWDERDKTFSRRRVHMGLERRRCWPLVARHGETAARSTRMARMAIAARPKRQQWKTGTGVDEQYPVARPPCCCCSSSQLPRSSRLCSSTLASEATQEDVALDAATGAENCRPDHRLG